MNPTHGIVALAGCGDYSQPALGLAVRRAVELAGGLGGKVKTGALVLIKPNLLAARAPEKRVCTDPAVVREVVRLVLDAGARPVIADSPAIEPFGRVAEKSGLAGVARELGVKISELKDPTPVELGEGSTRRRLELARLVLEADAVINLPKLKTHCQMLLTLGVKNLFGTVVAQRKSEWHYMVGSDRVNFAELLLDIHGAVRPSLTLVDGIWGMEGEGPSGGRPRHLGVLAASSDALALDMALCRWLGVELKRYPLYRAALRRGLIEADLSGILLAGAAPPPPSPPFVVPELGTVSVLPGVFDWFTRRYLVSKPVQQPGLCVSCGECARICPAHCIEVGEKGVAFDHGACIRCYCCQEVCPQQAIGFKTGWLVRLLNSLGR